MYLHFLYLYILDLHILCQYFYNTIMKTLTVFTPTFNRAYCLHRVYESLCRQTSQNFEWLIIDDGSTDNTRELFDEWSGEKKIDIRYMYQKNQGMHGTYNTAYANVKTELVTCIDSDDFLPDNAVELICNLWEKNGSKIYAGIIGLNQGIDGNIIGGQFPNDLKSSSVEDIVYKHKLVGDKKQVYRTEVVKKYPQYPLFEGENFVPHGTLFIQIDKDYELLCLNDVLCIVEYMEDGSTKNIFKQYIKYPIGFKYAREINIKYSKYWKVKIKNMIHLISCCFQLKSFNFYKNNKYPIMTTLLIPLGFLLFLYIKIRAGKLKY